MLNFRYPQASALQDQRKSRKTSVRRVGVLVGIRTSHLPDTSQKCHRLSILVESHQTRSVVSLQLMDSHESQRQFMRRDLTKDHIHVPTCILTVLSLEFYHPRVYLGSNLFSLLRSYRPAI